MATCYPKCVVVMTVEFPKDFNKTVPYITEKLRVVGKYIIYIFHQKFNKKLLSC